MKVANDCAQATCGTGFLDFVPVSGNSCKNCFGFSDVFAFHFSVPLRDQLVNLIFSPAGAILLNFAGLGLSYMSVFVFARRRSFLT